MQSIDAISPIDGRYSEKTKELTQFFSEAALMRYRVIVEGEYLIALSLSGKTHVRKFSALEQDKIRSLYDLSSADVLAIKKYEATTNHDVKAVEYFLKDKLGKTSLKDSIEWIHFALTSEDTNNSAYALMLSHGLGKVILPSLEELQKTFDGFAKQYAKLPMLARTHGQSASPTTLGHEFGVFAFRLKRQIGQLKSHSMLVKLSGATGNYNAHMVAYPNVDWKAFTKNFVADLSKREGARLEANFMTTQIESHDTYAELFDIMRRANTILIGFDQDMWRYISDSWLTQKPKAGEVGSSTMPHKINPIDFENSEGNLGIANALFTHFSTKLPISRLQRDLSDSTVERNFGVAFAHSLLAYQSTLKGLSKIAVNETKILEVLDDHPEVIAEAIQTVLRREGVAVPYEKLKELTRGKKVTLADFHTFIDGLSVSAKVKTELKKFTPRNYIGLAGKFYK